MESAQIQQNSNSLTQSQRSANYAKRNALKIECRHLAQSLPLLDKCEFCGETAQLERHHPDYNYYWIFATCCKACHEAIDRHPDNNDLAYIHKLKKFNHKLNNYRCGAYTIKTQLIEGIRTHIIKDASTNETINTLIEPTITPEPIIKLTLKQAHKLANKLDIYTEQFDKNGYPKNAQLYKRLKPSYIINDKQKTEVRYEA